MRPVSDAFLRIIRGSHVPIFRARLLSTFQESVNPTGGTDLPIQDGNIVFDASADIRGSLDMVVPAEYWPRELSDPLNPYGAEIFVERGVLSGGGQRIWIGQGYYRVESVEQDDVPRGSVRITGKDRMAGIIDGRLEAPVQFSVGATVADVFTELIGEIFPTATIEFDFTASASTFSGSHIAEEDRFEFLDDVVTGLGKIWYWDYRGRCVVKDAPSTDTPAWDVTHGPDGVLVEMSRERNRDGIYNIVVVNGEAPGGDPVRAVARDASPTSPTYYLGRFGRVPRFFSSPMISTQLGASTAASKILSRAIGLPYSINLSAIPNPALEVLDTVRITYGNDERDEVHAIEKLRMPLTVDGPMSGSTKDKTDLNIEVGL